MKKITLILFVIFSVLTVNKTSAQSAGFSYFFPQNGYFSNPVSPINFGYTVGFKYLRIEPELSFHSIGGMSMNNLPSALDSDRPLIGPFQSLKASLIPKIVIPVKNFQLDIEGGVFGFTSFNTKLMDGNFNNMLAEAYDYSAVSSDIQIDQNTFGVGYLGGIKISFRIKDNIWGFIEGKYYFGSQSMPLTGKITAADKSFTQIERNIEYKNSELNFSGLEITIGGEMRKN